VARRIIVTVKTNSKVPSVTRVDGGGFFVAVREPARDGKANRALVELLARHLGIAKSTIKIIRGERSRHKVLEWG
jgi:uncharacterized protein YggU (UPF0235/DUF167 family)